MRRLPGLVGLCVAIALLSTGCSVPGLGKKPNGAFEDLAKALTSRKLDSVHLGGATGAAAQKQLDSIVSGISELRAQVTAGSITSHGNTATAVLSWKWQVAGTTWAYPTHAKATKGKDGWAVTWTPTLVEPSLKAGEVLSETTLDALRGDIDGADGRPLVELRPVRRFGIDKTKVAAAGQVATSAARLARLLGIDPGAYQRAVAAAGPRAFVEALVLRQGAVPASVANRYAAIPGAVAISDHLPLAPTKDFAAAILGTVGPATAEVVKDSKGRVRAGDDVGLSGLESRYDAQLAGTNGLKIVAVDPKGARRALFSVPAVNGKPLGITLDASLQAAAQNALADVGPASALVAIRPSTGALVAVASGPGSNGYNTATIGQYAPGSTFKIVTSLALLRSGLTESSIVPCNAKEVVNGKAFKNYSDYPADRTGRITLKTALANSCNTAFISQRGHLTPTLLKDAATSLGFGVDHNVGFPSFFGSIPEPTGETEKAADMIGQGKVLASPMAMATVVASVEHGSVVVPHLLSGTTVAAPQVDKPLTAAEDASLKDMMRAVVTEGSGALLGDLSGPPVIAKTGTAEYGEKLPLPTHAWMVAGQGDLAVAVFVSDGATGSGVAGPLLKRFLQSVR